MNSLCAFCGIFEPLRVGTSYDVLPDARVIKVESKIGNYPCCKLLLACVIEDKLACLLLTHEDEAIANHGHIFYVAVSVLYLLISEGLTALQRVPKAHISKPRHPDGASTVNTSLFVSYFLFHLSLLLTVFYQNSQSFTVTVFDFYQNFGKTASSPLSLKIRSASCVRCRI